MAVDRTIPPPRTIRFGPFELDVRAAELRKHGIRIRLHEQPFRILFMLLEHPGEVVLRDEIRQALWPNNTIVEFDHSINAAIQRLRDALGDSADNPRYVETVARRGYRFIGTVEAKTPTPPAAEPVPAADPSDLSGQTFSHFRVIAKLGSGGMGVVYRAEDLKLGRQVALKFLPLPAHEAPAGLLERFQREARAASALNHPNICTIYGVEELAGQPVIVMELLEGETLEARIAKGSMALEKALPLALQLVAALDAAHRKGVVHRDLKPANIMLTKSGLKVLDFGLAKMERAIVAGEETATDVTQAGTILGTWQYMSPEQAQGKEADARSDIFSFGLVLYETTTGKRAFEGSDPASIIAAILEREAPALEPEGLNRVVKACLAKNPEDRFQTAHDLAFALEALSGGSAASATGAPAPAEAGPRRRRWLVAAAAVVVLIAAAGAWWLAGRSHSAWPVKFERLTFRRELVQGARFAPDRRSVIYGSYMEGRPVELFSIQPGRPESTRPLGFPSTGLLAIAPSGEMAVSTNCSGSEWGGGCRGTLGEMNVAGGAPREILENVSFADWTPDGRQLAVITGLGAYGRPNRLEFPIGKVLFEATGVGWPGDPRVSPKGDLVAFVDHFTYGNDGSVAVVDLRGRKQALTRTFGEVGGLAWSPNGKEIWFTGASELGLVSIYAVTPSGAMRTVAQMPADLRLQDIAPDGRLLLTTLDERAGVYFLGPGESRARELTWLDFGTNPILSADGKRMLLTEGGEAVYGKSTLYIRGTDGSPAVRLGDSLTGESISPDGQWATARTYSDAPVRLVLVPLKAGKQAVIDTGSLELARQPANGTRTLAWFPDSRRILYPATEPGHRTRTFVQDINGGPPRPVTPEGISGSVLTVDGTTLLAWDEESKAFLYPLDGGTPKPLPFLTRDYNALSFSADGRSLYVTRHSEGPFKVWRVDLGNGRVELWRELPYIDPAGRVSVRVEGITPDGKSLAYVVFRNLSELYLVEGLK